MVLSATIALRKSAEKINEKQKDPDSGKLFKSPFKTPLYFLFY
jgi:hypothetical protein